MKVLVKEWPNRTATIMTENGQVVWTFSSVAAARAACHEWQGLGAGEALVIVEDIIHARDNVMQVA